MDLESGRHSVITAISWIPRGVAAEKPQQVDVEPSTLKELIDGSAPLSTEDDQTTEAEELEEKPSKSKGIRGSAPKKAPVKEGDEYNLEDYDGEISVEPSIKGLAVYSSILEDPYVTKHNDSEDEAETEALKVHGGDNLVVTAKFEEDDATLVVYLYNTEGDFYVHHDYPLAAPILCMEPIGYDPGVDGKKGNLLAVGTMNPAIEIWDLDIVNSVKPIGKLEGPAKPGSKKKRDGSAQGHSDAVLSLAWNQEADHLLASGGADQTVVLWDLDQAKAAQVLSLEGMVQTLAWQPQQASVLLSGTRSGSAQIHECSSDNVIQLFQDPSVEIEKAHWDKFNENYIYLLTSDGKLRYLDARQPGQVVAEVQAHEGEGAVFTQSAHPGLIGTAGNEEIKFWNLNGNELELVHTKQLGIGRLHSAAFNPDVPNVILVGGEKKELIRLYDVAKSEEITAKYPNLTQVQEPEILEEDNVEVDMDE